MLAPVHPPPSLSAPGRGVTVRRFTVSRPYALHPVAAVIVTADGWEHYDALSHVLACDYCGAQVWHDMPAALLMTPAGLFCCCPRCYGPFSHKVTP